MMIEDIKKIGLNEREAQVYLVLLELGSASVQRLARRSNIPRASTYLIIDSLMNHGLVSKSTEGKRTRFNATSPRQLRQLIKNAEIEIEERRETLELLLPHLETLTHKAHGHPRVRYYAGIDGLRAIRHEMVIYTSPNDTWYNFTSIDYLQKVFGKDFLFYQQRLAKGIKSKTIFSTSSEKIKKTMLATAVAHKAERKYVPPEAFSSSSGITIFRDRIAIGCFDGNTGGVVIESDLMAKMMTEFFTLLWNKLD